MKTTKNIILISGIISLILISSCGKTPEQKAQEIKESDKKVNVIGILKSGDPSKCNELKDEQKVKNCINNLYYNKAIVENNVATCDKIEKTDSKSLCKAQIYYNQALTNADKKYCDKIEKEQLKTDCKNNVVMNKALQENSIEVCKEYIGDIVVCKDEVNKTFAISKNDPKYCNYIKDKNRNNICKMSVAQSNPTSTGTNLPPPTTPTQGPVNK